MNTPLTIVAIPIIVISRLQWTYDYRIFRLMDDFSTNLIKAMGGTTAVSRRTEAPVTTVHSWKRNGIPPSRLAHLKMIAEQDGLAVDWQTGCALDHGGDTNGGGDDASSGKAEPISAPQVSA
jgi:hypothetical protein